MSMEKRIEKLESEVEAIHPENPLVKLIIIQSCCGPDPTEEEIEAAKKKFLEEHPNHRGVIMLNFLHEGKHFHHGEEIDYRPFKQLEA